MNENPYKSIFILATTMLIAMIMASTVLIYVKMNTGEPINTDYTEPFILIAMAIGAVSIPMGFIVYKNSISKARQQSIIDDKIRGARTAIIIRSATWEGGMMLNLVAFFLYNSCLSLIMAGAIVLLFVALLPFPSRIKNDLEIE
jgi:hypothetical protein